MLLDFLFISKYTSARIPVYTFGFNCHLYVDWATTRSHWTLCWLFSACPWALLCPALCHERLISIDCITLAPCPALWLYLGNGRMGGKWIRFIIYLPSSLLNLGSGFSSCWLVPSLPPALSGLRVTSFPPLAPLYLELRAVSFRC